MPAIQLDGDPTRIHSRAVAGEEGDGGDGPKGGGDEPKGGLGLLFVAAALGLGVLLTVIALIAYAAMR